MNNNLTDECREHFIHTAEECRKRLPIYDFLAYLRASIEVCEDDKLLNYYKRQRTKIISVFMQATVAGITHNRAKRVTKGLDHIETEYSISTDDVKKIGSDLLQDSSNIFETFSIIKEFYNIAIVPKGKTNKYSIKIGTEQSPIGTIHIETHYQEFKPTKATKNFKFKA